MIITERLAIGGRDFVKTYSDLGMMVERDGVRYSEAIDPAEFGRVYTETDEPIVKEEETEGGEDGGNDETRRDAEAVE
jgi:hypothetical protein